MAWYEINIHVQQRFMLNCVGTKNVAKELAKITKGRVRDRDVTWFTELADKRMSVIRTVEFVVYM